MKKFLTAGSGQELPPWSPIQRIVRVIRGSRNEDDVALAPFRMARVHCAL